MGLLDRIKENEGFKDREYLDHLKVPTIGYGFAIKDLVLDKDIAEMILERKVKDLMIRINKKFPWFKSAKEEVREVVIEMCYQLGIRGFSAFRKTIEHLENKRYGKAAVEMLDSKWGREQTPERALRLSNIIKELE